jgi:rod shape-determining protein MreC
LAAPKDRPRIGPFAILGLFLLGWIFVPFGWKIIIQSSFDEFQAPLWEITSRISDLSDYWGHQTDSKKTLIEKNRDLTRVQSDWHIQKLRKSELETELTRINNLKAHIRAIESSIGLDPSMSYRPVIARISHRSLSAWWQSLTVRKGVQHNLYTGLGAINREGVVGRLSNVSSRSSEVQLASNSNFRIVASFRGDNRPVTFQGGGISPGGRPWGMVFDVPHDLQASEKNPLLLVSSELGGTFPHGLPIGRVTSLEESGDGLFKNGKVYLPFSISNISEVTLLVPEL